MLRPDPRPFEVEFVAYFENYKLPDSDKIRAEMIQTGGEILLSEIYNLYDLKWWRTAWEVEEVCYCINIRQWRSSQV
jgi:hypothetical protein